MRRRNLLLLKQVSGALIIAISCIIGAMTTKMVIGSQDECVNAKAKFQVGKEFCSSLAIRMVEEQCFGLEPQVSEECRSTVHSFISDSCANYIGLERLSSESISLCD